MALDGFCDEQDEQELGILVVGLIGNNWGNVFFKYIAEIDRCLVDISHIFVEFWLESMYGNILCFLRQFCKYLYIFVHQTLTIWSMTIYV